MVKPEFEQVNIDVWVSPEKLGNSTPSLCLFHSSKQFGNPLLDAIDELQIEGSPSRRTLTFMSSSRPRGITTLRMCLVAQRDDLRVMNIACEASVATIQMTCEGLRLIRKAIVTWLDGTEDFGVSSRHSALKSCDLGQLDRDSGELWFWGPGYLGP